MQICNNSNDYYLYLDCDIKPMYAFLCIEYKA